MGSKGCVSLQLCRILKPRTSTKHLGFFRAASRITNERNLMRPLYLSSAHGKEEYAFPSLKAPIRGLTTQAGAQHCRESKSREKTGDSDGKNADCTEQNTMGKYSELIPVPQSLLSPMNFPQKLLMGPGPSNAPPRVLAAGAMPILGHMHTELWQILDEIKEGIQYAFQTKNQITLSISATGHGGMEAACCNMIEAGDVVLVAKTGIWGERFGDMADRHGADVRFIEKPPGEVFSHQEIEEALKKHKPSVMFITHGESSSGTTQPLEDLGHLCHRYNTLLIVDSVAALGGVPMYMDKWGLDVVYTGSQKVLGSPAGSAPISFSPAAWDKIKNRKTKVRSFYFDMNWLANYWGCDDKPRTYHHTTMSNVMYNLRESFSILAEETLEACWERHRNAAQILWDGLEKMGLELFVKDPAIRLPTVTAIVLPEGLDWKAVNAYMMNKHKIEISGGLGPSAGKVWRIGVMGYNANPDTVNRTLKALEEAIKYVRDQPKAKL